MYAGKPSTLSLRPPLFIITSDKEKTAMKKSSPREVPLIHDVIPRFFYDKCLPLSLFSFFFSLFLDVVRP
ncbi:hypothetical protein B296_00027006 [Ensete ventricosum]|uniref:Uncharacterized protein n=1 Tax=Ensete ventricosum TaxID=4639 RepID=A0A426XW35_ENSVE|nr:hypothetical protein B296_00027006 [Ensete ventricosum]